jgi:dihydrofolate synthase / folylpolyglutamate synthase
MTVTDRKIEELLEQRFKGEFFSGGFNEHQVFFRPYVVNIQTKVKKTIIVGGTNGKGETSRAISYMLSQAKLNHALLTSPHIERLNERFAFMGSYISNDDLYFYLNEAIERSTNIKLSYYELLFFTFLLWIRDLDINYLVLEVGLGGRLDSVNYFSADLAIITSISRDHCELLGNRFEQILIEKLGIARNGKLLLTSFKPRYLAKLTKNISINEGYLWHEMQDQVEDFFNHHYSTRNWLTASAALRLLDLGRLTNNVLYQQFRPRFRMSEALSNFPHLYFFPGHNLEGFREYRRYSDDVFKGRIIETVIISFSKRPKREAQSILIILSATGAKKIILTSFEHYKAMAESELLEIFHTLKEKDKIQFDRDWQKYIEKEKLSLVCGSNYFLGHVCKRLDSSYTT